MESLGAAMPGVGYLLGGAIVALGSPHGVAVSASVVALLVLLAARAPAACPAIGRDAARFFPLPNRRHRPPPADRESASRIRPLAAAVGASPPAIAASPPRG